MMFLKRTTFKKLTLCFFTLGVLSSCCGNKIPTDDCGGRFFQYLPEFHYAYFSKGIDAIKPNDLSLYVDYSTCNVLGQNSAFYQALVPSWVAASKRYYSIKGSEIEEEKGPTFNLLRTIQEVNFADLKGAVEKMANSNSESVLLTDGEYFQQSIAKGNINNPYMADALKTWLKKGHDIFVFTEPYIETYKGQSFNKKRFYILFTDVRLPDNIYDRIMQTAKLQQFPNVEMFHLSADHPSLSAEGTTSTPHENLSAIVKGFGSFEAQEWQIDWSNGIEPLIVYATDSLTGNPLPNGEMFTGGIKVDRNSFGGYRITNVEAKVYNINQEFTDFCTAKASGQRIGGKLEPMPQTHANFAKIDEKEFKKHGIIRLHFDAGMFYPDEVLNGSPFNFTKIDVCISEVQDVFSQYAHMFEFESIDMPGQTNSSVAESVKQCLADPDIKSMITSCPIYSIYIKSIER
jgi:hypothetical protein